MTHSTEIGELAKALAQAQGEMRPAGFDAINPHYKSKYSKLPAVWDACREPLSKNGLCVMQTISEQDGKVYLTTTLAHSSGQWIKSILPVISTKADNHGMTSGITYSRRNALSAIVGVVSDDDDDGNECVKFQQSHSKPVDPIIIKCQADELAFLIDKLLPEEKKHYLNQLSASGIMSIYEIPLSQYFPFKKSIEEFLGTKK